MQPSARHAFPTLELPFLRRRIRNRFQECQKNRYREEVDLVFTKDHSWRGIFFRGRSLPFSLSLSFDFAQDARKEPIMVSLSNNKPVLSEPFLLREPQGERRVEGLSTNGFETLPRCLLNYRPISSSTMNTGGRLWDDTAPCSWLENVKVFLF